ncbi:MAG: hypothetical protein FWG65_02365, partial [Turicibacter sp.]|nr:hypothetical protein [Turicibacter sp.]
GPAPDPATLKSGQTLNFFIAFHFVLFQSCRIGVENFNWKGKCIVLVSFADVCVKFEDSLLATLIIVLVSFKVKASP